MSVNIKPLEDRILVKTLDAEQTTASGLVIPDTAKEKPQKGKVLAVGDGAINEDGSRRPLDVSEGDEVLYSKYGGTEITVDGDELLVLRETDVLARRRTAVVLGIAAFGELIADKLPFTPSRVRPVPYAARVVTGGTAAAFQSLAEGRPSDRGALLGALGAAI